MGTEYFQHNLKRLMDLNGWSIKQLALESNVSYHTVFRAVSKGIIPRGENQLKLATALDVRVADLHVEPGPVSPTKVHDKAFQKQILARIYADPLKRQYLLFAIFSDQSYLSPEAIAAALAERSKENK